MWVFAAVSVSGAVLSQLAPSSDAGSSGEKGKDS